MIFFFTQDYINNKKASRNNKNIIMKLNYNIKIYKQWTIYITQWAHKILCLPKGAKF